jgi:hypothetical protein
MENKVFSTYNQYDPVLNNVIPEVKVPVISGAQEINAFKQAASTASSSGITWNYLPIGGTLVSPLVYWQQTMTVTVQGGKAGSFTPNTRTVLDIGGVHSFSRYPLLSMINNSIVTMDTATISEEYGEVWDATNQLIDSNSEKKWSSLQPVGPDVYAVNANIPAGDVHSPFVGFGKSVDEYNRGGFSISNVTAITNPVGDGASIQTATFTCTMTTPLLVKPFSLRADAVDGGFDLRNKLTVNLMFKQLSNMNFIRNKDAVPLTITNITMQNSDANLLMFVYMPHPTKPIPVRSSHVYHHITRSQINFTPAAQGSKTSITSPSINLGVMPEKIIIFARKLKSQATPQDADAFLHIDNVSISLDGKSNLLSNATDQQLYNFSVEAGLQRKSWSVYSGSIVSAGNGNAADTLVTTLPTVSAPVYLDVGRHVQTNALAVPNEIGNFNCFVKCDVYSQFAPGASNYELVVLYLHRAILTLQNGVGVVLNSGLLDRSEVLSVLNEPSQMWKDYKLYGGANWFEKEIYKNKKGKKDYGHLENKLADLEEKYRQMEEKHRAKEGEGRASGRASGFDPSQALIAKMKSAQKH